MKTHCFLIPKTTITRASPTVRWTRMLQWTTHAWHRVTGMRDSPGRTVYHGRALDVCQRRYPDTVYAGADTSLLLQADRGLDTSAHKCNRRHPTKQSSCTGERLYGKQPHACFIWTCKHLQLMPGGGDDARLLGFYSIYFLT